MKRIWILCALLALLLTACGNAKTPEPLPEEDSPETAPAQLEVEDEAPDATGIDADVHQPAETPQTVDDPVSGYCGNTVTTVRAWDDEEEFSFWGDDSVTLTDIVINLDYNPDAICRCLPEYEVDTEFGDGYGVNLSDAYVRCDAGQASLTTEQAETIQNIILRNCV